MTRNVNYFELSVELTLLGLPHVVKNHLRSMAKSSRKSKFHPCMVFSTRALLRDGQHVIREFHSLH